MAELGSTKRTMPDFDADFFSSAPTRAACPRWDRIEIALAGRSNVGKSSLLNAIIRSRNLARTSKTPGRTQSLNFFTLGDSLALVDLPGYGYAKIPQAQARAIATMMLDYLEHRENLAAIVLLVDSRRGPQREEIELYELARSRNLAALVVATKSDKLRSSERAAALARFEALRSQPLFCSATVSEGIAALRRRIISLGNAAVPRAERDDR
ncbi:MAG TPA: ribosome biogenesis GTP-binding protein YihA/YsxC [Candidatus Binataceae bacterium]